MPAEGFSPSVILTKGASMSGWVRVGYSFRFLRGKENVSGKYCHAYYPVPARRMVRTIPRPKLVAVPRFLLFVVS